MFSMGEIYGGNMCSIYGETSIYIYMEVPQEIKKRATLPVIHMTKDGKDLYTENYKALLRDLNKWREIPYSWIRKDHIGRCQFSPD